MREPADKVNCFQHPTPVYMSSPSRPSGVLSPLLRFGALALVLTAVLLLCASVAALFFWKVTDRTVYNVRYSMNINGELREASAEIDSDNNLERFKAGDGAEALEIHDFQSGITGIRFFGGDKCYIKSQIKDNLPDVETENRELLTPDPRDEILPVRSEEDIMTWVVMDQPLKDTKVLSKKITSLCKDLPIYWLQPADPQDGARRHRREAERAGRQVNSPRSRPAAKEERGSEEEAPRAGAEQEDNGSPSAGSAFNPENPYHGHHSAASGLGLGNTPSEGAREEGAVAFDPMLDHRGICCAECQRGYTHCQRICEPLYGHWPWPYHYRGCQVACRVIMPCRWWVARILGLV